MDPSGFTDFIELIWEVRGLGLDWYIDVLRCLGLGLVGLVWNLIGSGLMGLDSGLLFGWILNFEVDFSCGVAELF